MRTGVFKIPHALCPWIGATDSGSGSSSPVTNFADPSARAEPLPPLVHSDSVPYRADRLHSDVFEAIYGRFSQQHNGEPIAVVASKTNVSLLSVILT
jgi:hypothetical protein